MTVTPTPRRAPRRAPRSRWAAAIVAVVALLAPVTIGAPAMGAAAATTPSPSPSATASGETTFTLSPVGSGIVRPGDALTVSVTLDNDTSADLPATPVTLSLGATPLADRAALAAWLAGEGAGPLVPVGSTTFAPVAAGEAETTGVMVAATDPVLAGRLPGVYPLVATYDGPDGLLSSTSAMIVPDPAAAESPLGVVVPITAAPRTTGLLTTDELAALTAPEGALTSALDAVDGTTAILAIDPAIPAAIRVLGTAAPASATEWLERLLALPNSRFALQFGDADVVAQLQAGLPRPAKPTSLRYAMLSSTFAAPSPSPTPTPTATTDPGRPTYPSLDELLFIGSERTAVFWPGDGTATAATVATLGGITVEDQRSLTLLPSTSTTAGAAGATVTAHHTVAEADVLVYDAAVSRALQQASVLDDSALRGAELTVATAYLAFAQRDAGGGPLLVSLGREIERSRVAMGATLLAATQAPGVVSAALNALEQTPPGVAEVSDGVTDPQRSAAASTLFSEEEGLGRFATILDDPSLLTGPERTAILQLLGVGWLRDPAQWATAVADHRVQTTATLSSVGLLPVPDIQQIGPNADIPVWVRNDLPFEVNVVLHASPDDLRLDIERSTPVRARQNSNTRVLIPVNAQIGSGEVQVSLELSSPTFQPVGQAQVALVTVRADWERYGIIALGTIVAGLLVIGVIRTLRRRRTRNIGRTVATDAPPTDGDDPEARAPHSEDAL